MSFDNPFPRIFDEMRSALRHETEERIALLMTRFDSLEDRFTSLDAKMKALENEQDKMRSQTADRERERKRAARSQSPRRLALGEDVFLGSKPVYITLGANQAPIEAYFSLNPLQAAAAQQQGRQFQTPGQQDLTSPAERELKASLDAWLSCNQSASLPFRTRQLLQQLLGRLECQSALDGDGAEGPATSVGNVDGSFSSSFFTRFKPEIAISQYSSHRSSSEPQGGQNPIDPSLSPDELANDQADMALIATTSTSSDTTNIIHNDQLHNCRPTSTDTPTPYSYKLRRGATLTIHDLWTEWAHGLAPHPPVRDLYLNNQYTWQRDKADSSYFFKRYAILQYIEKMLKENNGRLKEEEVLQLVEAERARLKMGLQAFNDVVKTRLR